MCQRDARPALVPLALCLLFVCGCASDSTQDEVAETLQDLPLATLHMPATTFSAKAELRLTPANLHALLEPVPSATWDPRVNSEKLRGGVEIFDAVAPAVVVVRTAEGHGTGVVIDGDGRILTNHHVVASGTFVDTEHSTSYASVHMGRFHDEGRMTLWPEALDASLLAVDARRDLALLKIDEIPDALQPLAYVTLADADARPGQSCAMVGHPSSGMLWTLRQGDVAALGEAPRDLVNLALPLLAFTGAERRQFDEQLARIGSREIVLSSCLANPGDSGGPLVDEKGRLIGLTFGGPGEATESKFTYHVALSEVKGFLAEAGDEPMLLLPDAWELGPMIQLLDPQVLVAGAETPTQFLIDLDGDTPKKPIKDNDLAALAGERQFDAELILHFSGSHRIAFYDLDDTAGIESILLDYDEDDAADRLYRLTPSGTWEVHDDVNLDWIDMAALQRANLDKQFVKLLKKIGLS